MRLCLSSRTIKQESFKTLNSLKPKVKRSVARLSFPLVFFLSLLYGLLANDAFAEQQTRTYSESQIKVALVYKLMHFIEWPDKSPLSLCVYKPNKEDVSSFRLMPPQTESGNALKVRLLYENNDALNLRSCQVIFFGSDADAEAKKILADAAGEYSLTIGETNQFIKHGGMINLIRKNLTIKFEINISALKKANLNISSQVLRIADQVYKEDGGE
jgi:YfiR/HmsC-like